MLKPERYCIVAQRRCLLVSEQRLQDEGGWRWMGGAAGRSGGSGIPDTELQSVWITSHSSFRAITTLTGTEAEGGSRDREQQDGHREPRG